MEVRFIFKQKRLGVEGARYLFSKKSVEQKCLSFQCSPPQCTGRRNFAVLCRLFDAQGWPLWVGLELESYSEGLGYTSRAQTGEKLALERLSVSTPPLPHNHLACVGTHLHCTVHCAVRCFK